MILIDVGKFDGKIGPLQRVNLPAERTVAVKKSRPVRAARVVEQQSKFGRALLPGRFGQCNHPCFLQFDICI